MDFAKKFLSLRKAAGLSQEEAANKLGVSRQAISRWEQGTALPDAFNLSVICKSIQRFGRQPYRRPCGAAFGRWCGK